MHLPILDLRLQFCAVLYWHTFSVQGPFVDIEFQYSPVRRAQQQASGQDGHEPAVAMTFSPDFTIRAFQRMFSYYGHCKHTQQTLALAAEVTVG